MKNAVMMLTVLLAVVAVPAVACDSDGDCAPGGICIKREKRAAGVCYGGQSGGRTSPETMMPETPAPVTGERRERATHWLGDPEALIRENRPDSEIGGTCVVTQDCAAGFECIVAGFEGRCVER